jgi:outer membrane protein
MIRQFALTLLSIVAVSASAADLKFGVVDMSKAFSDFHKTKEAAEKFKINLDKAQKEMNDRWSVYKNLMTDMQKLKKEASDPIMTQDARAKKGMEFEEKGKELRSLEQEIGEAQNRRNSQLKQEDMSIRKGIYDEILVVVKDKAKAEGYDFIFDKSGMSLSTVPVLIYYKDAVDVTDLIIVELNKNAPAATTPAPAAATPAEKKP